MAFKVVNTTAFTSITNFIDCGCDLVKKNKNKQTHHFIYCAFIEVECQAISRLNFVNADCSVAFLSVPTDGTMLCFTHSQVTQVNGRDYHL